MAQGLQDFQLALENRGAAFGMQMDKKKVNGPSLLWLYGANSLRWVILARQKSEPIQGHIRNIQSKREKER